jgi:hypothetical protein
MGSIMEPKSEQKRVDERDAYIYNCIRTRLTNVRSEIAKLKQIMDKEAFDEIDMLLFDCIEDLFCDLYQEIRKL